MSIYAIADLHLANDPNVDKSMNMFGGIWTEHGERLKDHWNDTVGDDDTVVIAGDTSWALTRDEAIADIDWLHGLKGKKILIKGNHDLWWTGINTLNSFYEDIYFLQNTSYETEGISIVGSRGWICPGTEGYDEHDERIYRRELLRLEASLKAAGSDEKIGFLHFPPTNERFEESGFTELFERYGVKKVYYGHLHGGKMFSRGLRGEHNGVGYDLISYDYLNGRPLLIKEG